MWSAQLLILMGGDSNGREALALCISLREARRSEHKTDRDFFLFADPQHVEVIATIALIPE